MPIGVSSRAGVMVKGRGDPREPMKFNHLDVRQVANKLFKNVKRELRERREEGKIEMSLVMTMWSRINNLRELFFLLCSGGAVLVWFRPDKGEGDKYF